jgi:hypothetical protein
MTEETKTEVLPTTEEVKPEVKKEEKPGKSEVEVAAGKLAKKLLKDIQLKETVQVALAAALKAQGAEYSLSNFRYQGVDMDVMAVIKNRVAEFVIIVNEDGLDYEKKKRYHLGAIQLNKQGAIRKGKALPRYYWYVFPEGSPLIGKEPEYAGVLTFDTKNQFKQHRHAPALHKSFISASTYKSIANHLLALKTP